MLYSQFFVEEDRYVISARSIIEIIPCVSLKSVPALPDYAVGIMNYHGVQLPVIDICQLLIGRPCDKKLSTRIIIVDYAEHPGISKRLGYLVEKATEVISIDEGLFKPLAMNNLESPIDGMIAINEGLLITKISIEDVFNKVDERLFQKVEAGAHEVEK